MIYKISDIITIGSWINYSVQDLYATFNNAHQLVKQKIINSGISIVQGPPGTGKTTVFLKTIETVLDNLDNNEIIVYIAPTNELVKDMSIKLASLYMYKEKSDDFIKEVKIYGSKFDYDRYPEMGKPIDKNTKIVISTEYQPVYPLSGKKIHFLIDEASKTILHKPFISLSREQSFHAFYQGITSNNSIISSFNVIGDPNQAIGLDEPYRTGKEQLIIIMMMRGLLRLKGIDIKNKSTQELQALSLEHLRNKYYEFLDTTLRLPSPSEIPISHGYYNGMLRSYFSAEKIFKDYWRREEADKIKRKSTEMEKIVDTLEDAITTGRPVIYVNETSSYEEDSNVNLKRIKLGLLAAVSLALITNKKTTIITTYADQFTQMKLLLHSKYIQKYQIPNHERHKISVTTIHSMLGSESENIIAILGKEHYVHPPQKTIYFQEPELFNVQLTRHKGVLIIIGDLDKLKETCEIEERIAKQKNKEANVKPIKTTIEEIENQINDEKFLKKHSDEILS